MNLFLNTELITNWVLRLTSVCLAVYSTRNKINDERDSTSWGTLQFWPRGKAGDFVLVCLFLSKQSLTLSRLFYNVGTVLCDGILVKARNTGVKNTSKHGV